MLAVVLAVTDDFREERLRGDVALARLGIASVLASLVYFVADVVRLLDAPDLLDFRLVTRAALLVSAGVAFVWLGRASTREEYARPVAFMGFALAAANVLITALRPTTAPPPLSVPLFNLTVMYFALPNRPALQIAPPLLQSVATLYFRLTAAGGVTTQMILDVTLLVAANLIGVFAVRRRARDEAATARIWDAEVAARGALEHVLGELRTLRGVIPICAYCHKIRSEAGAWERLERYITEHTHAEFSHGACPECSARVIREMDGAGER